MVPRDDERARELLAANRFKWADSAEIIHAGLSKTIAEFKVLRHDLQLGVLAAPDYMADLPQSPIED